MARLSLPLKVIKAIVDLVKVLKELSSVVKVYLFGSYAKGTWLEDGDVDLVTLSSYFEHREPVDRYRFVMRSASDEVPFEFLIYTSKEFEEALRKSIVLKDF